MKAGSDISTSDAAARATPSLSVVLVGYHGLSSILRGLGCLRRQSIRDEIELVLIVPNRDELLAGVDAVREEFHSLQVIEDRQIVNVDAAAAQGLRVARAPIIAVLEDHAYPSPNWAAEVLQAHEGPWAAVGSTFTNANPWRILSWANFYMSYGLWSEPIAEERGIGMSRHNISVKRSALEQIGDLEANMSRGGNLVGELERTPGGVCVASGVVVAHENFSRLVPTIGLRVQAGRLAAARRADRENWSAMRRLVYVLASPLIPLMRARVLMRKVIVPATHTSRAKRAAGLAVGCVLDAIGQAAGFAVGEGRVAENLAAFEFGRERFITKDDQSRLDLEYAHR